VYRAWQGEWGGKHPEAAYRRFVESGITDAPLNPLDAAVEGWLLGSQKFVDSIRQLIKSPKYQDEVPAARRISGVPLKTVLTRTAEHYGVEETSFARKHSKQLSRDVAAWLARRLTVATLRDLMEPFGLTHPDSVRGLINRAESAMENSNKVRKEVQQLRQRLQTDK
jgi:hypothetical protein